jgi:hypothetical protein
MLKKISAVQLDLSAFAKKEALSIDCYKYLAIDLSTVSNDSEGFKTALQCIHMMNPKMRFIYVDIGSNNMELQNAVRKYGDVPVITAEPEEARSEFKNQMAAALNYETEFNGTEKEKQSPNADNMPSDTKQDSAASKKEYIFEKDITVAVINAYPRAGATTVSINMAQYLDSIGAAAAYVECSGGIDHLEQIRNNTSGFTTINSNTFKRNGVIYRKNETPDEAMDFTICDMGEMLLDNSEDPALVYAVKCDVIILCGTSKPYELEAIHEKLELLQNYGCKICLCLSFTPDKEKANLVDMFGSANVRVYFIDYTPDMFESSSNEEVYRRILQEYIQEKVNDNMLKLF